MAGHKSKPSTGDAASLFGTGGSNNASDFFASTKQNSFFDAVPEEEDETPQVSSEGEANAISNGESIESSELPAEDDFLDDSAYDEMAESWMPPVAPSNGLAKANNDFFGNSQQLPSSYDQPHSRIASASSTVSSNHLTPQMQSNPYFPPQPQDYSPYGSPTPQTAESSPYAGAPKPAPALMSKKKLDAYDPPAAAPKLPISRRNTPSIMQQQSPFGLPSPSIYGVPPPQRIASPPTVPPPQAVSMASRPSQPPPPRRAISRSQMGPDPSHDFQPMPSSQRPISVPPAPMQYASAQPQIYNPPPAPKDAPSNQPSFSGYSARPPIPPQQGSYSQASVNGIPPISQAQSNAYDPYASPDQPTMRAAAPPAPPQRILSPPPPPPSRPQSRTQPPPASNRPQSRSSFDVAANIPLPPSRVGMHQQSQPFPPRTSSPLARRQFGSHAESEPDAEEQVKSPVPNLAFQPPSPVGNGTLVKSEDPELESITPDGPDEEEASFSRTAVKAENFESEAGIEVKTEDEEEHVTPVMKQEATFGNFSNWYDEQDQLRAQSNETQDSPYMQDSTPQDIYSPSTNPPSRQASETMLYSTHNTPASNYNPYPQVPLTTDPESMQDYRYDYSGPEYSPAQDSHQSSGSTADSTVESAAGTYATRSDRTNSLEGASRDHQIGYNPANDLYSSYNPRRLSYSAQAESPGSYSQVLPSMPSAVPAQVAAVPFDPYAPRSRSGSTHSNTIPDYTPMPQDVYGISSSSSRQHVNGMSNSDGQQDNLTRVPCPLINFGLGGRLITYFPPDANNFQSTMYGTSPYDAAAQGLSSSSHVLRFSNLASNLSTTLLSSFPGPLYMDGGAGKAVSAKKKKDALQWIDEQVGDVEKELGYIASHTSLGTEEERSEKKRKVEDRKILFSIVKILLEFDGKLTSPESESKIRDILRPSSRRPSAGDFSTAAELSVITSTARSSSPPISSTHLHSSDLAKIQDHLEDGNRQEAILFAINNKLWAHALIMSSSLDKDTWRKTVSEFVRSELPTLGPQGQNWEALRMAYNVFSGEDGNAIRQPQSQMQTLGDRSPRTTVPPSLSRAPSRAASPAPAFLDSQIGLPEGALKQWRSTALIMLANKTAGGNSTLMSLGDALNVQGYTSAAHACYLLYGSSASSIGGLGQPGIRATILGCESPAGSSAYTVDLDGIMLTEVLEFALGLIPAVKGQEAYHGLPHLQAYRLLHAVRLADIGLQPKALKYCDAIAATLKASTKPSAFYHPALVAQVKELSDRLNGSSARETSGSWVSRKMPRPTLDSIWSNLEGRFASFVAGDDTESTRQAETQKKTAFPTQAAGPFAQYTAISSQNNSGNVSRQASHSDLRSAMPPPQPNTGPYGQPTYSANLSSSPPKNPIPMGPPRGRTHQSQPSLGALASGSDPYAAAPAWGAPPPFNPSSTPSQNEEDYEGTEVSAAPAQNTSDGWWGAAHDNESTTPTTPVFQPINQSYSEDDSGFISPMGATSRSTTPSVQASSNPSTKLNQAYIAEEDEEDLGFGNSSSRKPSNNPSPAPNEAAQAAKPSEAPPSAAANTEAHALRNSASSSWLGRLFRKDSNSPGPGPIRAKLGEETSFVYDPEQKRWVNKKVGDTSAAAPVAVPSPPPSRAQTVSPAPTPSESPPVPRFASASPPPMSSRPPLGSGPPPRSFSTPSQQQQPPVNTGLPGPPAPSNRPPVKRAARSKYVVID